MGLVHMTEIWRSAIDSNITENSQGSWRCIAIPVDVPLQYEFERWLRL